MKRSIFTRQNPIFQFRLFFSAVLLALLFNMAAKVPASYAAIFDLSGSCPGGVGDVPALVAAINAANGNGEDDTITLSAGCVYTLTVIDNATDGNNGLPLITSSITINGNGAVIQRDNAFAPDFRIFHVSGTGNLTLNNLTIRYGAADNGGGIYNNGGVLALNGVTVTLNTVTYVIGGKGGGIYNGTGGQVTIENSTVSQNTAAGSDNTGGGGMANYGTVTITSSTFSSNTCANGYGGGGLFAGDGTITVSGSTFNGNSGYEGGGIATRVDGGAATLIVTNSTFSGNQATGEYGCGGGISSNGDLNISGSTFTSNAATGLNGHGGGGLYHINEGATIANSTFSGNSSVTNAGGIYFRDWTMTLNYVTIASNTADSNNNGTGNGGGVFVADWGGTIQVGNTIIAQNSDLSGGGPDCFTEGTAVLTSQDYNLIQDITGCTITGSTANNITGADPNLGPLQDNGGPTHTCALLTGSPAIDEANPGSCLPIDQRGVARPQGSGCDIGAYEAQLSAPTVTTQDVTAITTTTATGNGTITDLGSPNPTAHGICWNTSGNPTTADNHTDEGAASATGPFTASMTGLSPNTTYYVRAYATNTAGTVYGNEVSFLTATAAPIPTFSEWGMIIFILLTAWTAIVFILRRKNMTG